MKRHASLVTLSREHHGALILAQLLKKDAPVYKGLPTEPGSKADYAFLYYRDELNSHFEQEEQVVIKMTKGMSEELDQLAGEIILEHKALRQLFNTISRARNLDAHLDQLGCLLERHIRKEERELFPMIQALCSETLLTEIEKALSA